MDDVKQTGEDEVTIDEGNVEDQSQNSIGNELVEQMRVSQRCHQGC